MKLVVGGGRNSESMASRCACLLRYEYECFSGSFRWKAEAVLGLASSANGWTDEKSTAAGARRGGGATGRSMLPEIRAWQNASYAW